MKRDTPALTQRLRRINPSRLLSSILLGFILVIYAYIVYTIVVSLGTFPFGKTPSGSLLPSAEQWQLNLIALLILSLTFVPLSRWLQGQINELIYTSDPYLLPATVAQQLRGMQSLPLTIPNVLETITTTLHSPYAALVLEINGQQTFSFGSKQDEVAMEQLPIRYLDEPLGMLLVSHRGARHSLSYNDLLALRECAQQIGVALTVVRLTAVLQTSREQTIIAREEERRRIRNDLHDGLAPTLSSFQLQLGAIRRVMTQNPAQAEQMIAELSKDLREETAVIRQLVYDLRPPLLDQLGLIEAIKQIRLADESLQLEIIAPNPLPQLSAAAEVALYRIVTEALHNVSKHAQATNCTITLAAEPASLLLTIVDNGQGIAPNQLDGVGIQSMGERAAELGGTFNIQPAGSTGTHIEVRLPLSI